MRTDINKIDIQGNQVNYTYHAHSRMSQRGISKDAIQACSRYGEVIHRQGLRFLYVPKRKLDLLEPGLKDKVKDLVIVLDKEIDTLLTCYRNNKAPHRIKKKPKRLSKSGNH